MIRRLKSGGYRLYSRKRNPRPENVGISARFPRWLQPKSMSAPCNSLNDRDDLCQLHENKSISVRKSAGPVK